MVDGTVDVADGSTRDSTRDGWNAQNVDKLDDARKRRRIPNGVLQHGWMWRRAEL
jgi:hypothetical protein